MSKSKARIRIGEARRKIQKVIFECEHLTPAQTKRLNAIYYDLLNLTSKMM